MTQLMTDSLPNVTIRPSVCGDSNTGRAATKYPTVSIVINTLNRARELEKTLESFCWLKYGGEFEVIVVNGPSDDNSDEIIAQWRSKIRAAKCDVANLSVSRNVGICLARGDVIAFIDDDAIPEPEWLTQLVDPYSDPMVGASGGLVYDHTGYKFQYKYCLVDRFGNADLSLPGPMPHLAFPKSYKFPHLLGCNSSFRRSALLEVRGFDEEYEYFLDETDLCLRIVDAGYIIAQVKGAYVHHKFAPSNIRGTNRVARSRYAILKNKLYFMLKHAREFHPLARILEEHAAFTQQHRGDIEWAVREKLLSEADGIQFNADVERSIEVGLKRGFEGQASGSTITPEKQRAYEGNFAEFTPIRNSNRKVVVIISRDFPPDHGGGIATFSKSLAESLAALGNIVHVVAQSSDINRVDFESGVWVHRLKVTNFELSPEASDRGIPPHIWNWSATAFAETRRISSHRPVDVVEAPIWDCEGIAFLLSDEWPLITSLHTTLHTYLEFHPEQVSNEGWMTSFARPMLSLEKDLMSKATCIRANSRAIVMEIERAYKFIFRSEATRIIPHGLNKHAPGNNTKESSAIEVLFVGRLEPRKGIDVLLKAIPIVAKSRPDVVFNIVGDDCAVEHSQITYRQKFQSENEGASFLDRVLFRGRFGGDALLDAYASCDIFVAPSRFESFGLVFLEAMRDAKPVIGCVAGGVPEVVEHGTTGLLVKPDDPAALAAAIITLVGDPGMRRSMGDEGHRHFNEKFSAQRMAVESLALYDLARMRHESLSQ
jgi:glycogen synthase